MKARNLTLGSGVFALGAQLGQIEVVAHVVVELPLPRLSIMPLPGHDATP